MEKLSIVKIGGNVIDNDEALNKFLKDLSTVKGKKILVHGGGKTASEVAWKLGISQALVNGRRITDAETLKVTAMVYAGLLNKRIVALMQSMGINALGLSGADLNSVQTSKRKNIDIDYGYVGDMNEGSINVKAISALLDAGITPVFCSITHDGKGQLLNTNADTIASALAVATAGLYEVQLNYCFEKKGVMKDVEDENSVIGSITKTSYKKLLGQGAISKGMIPKLDNSFEAINKGVSAVIIGHSDNIVKMIQRKKHEGTELVA